MLGPVVPPRPVFSLESWWGPQSVPNPQAKVWPPILQDPSFRNPPRLGLAVLLLIFIHKISKRKTPKALAVDRN